MQINKKFYYPEKHDLYKALAIQQPRADAFFGIYDTLPPLSIEVRSFNTSYRGDLMITSTKSPSVFGHETGATIGLVELYDVKPLEELTPEEWKQTGLPPTVPGRYAWFFRNPRRVVPMPVNGNLKIYDLVVPKGDITEYPRNVIIGSREFRNIKNRINK